MSSQNQIKALFQKEDLIQSNLSEIFDLKEKIEKQNKKIQNFEQDLKNGPSVATMHELYNKIARVERESKQLQEENDNLENQVMLLKNK